jgi:hypothetical protein
MKVQTIKGLLDRSKLEVKDVVVEEGNARITATEWYLANELVRRDVNVNVLRGLSLEGTQSVI